MGLKKIGKIKNTVGYGLFKNVFFVYIIIAFLITISHMYSEYHNAKNNILNDMTNTYKVLEKQLTTSIWNIDYELVEDIIDGILTSEHIVGVSIKINDGQSKGNFGQVDIKNKINKNIFFDNSREVTYSQDLYSLQFELSNNAYDEGASLGSLYLYSSDMTIYKRVKNNFLLILVNSAIKTIALWLIFLFFANKYLTIPLFEMIAITQKIDSKKLDKIKFEHNKENQNEFDILKCTFNKMIKKLNHSNKENLQLNKYLEEKVKLRTQELEESLSNLKQTQEKLIESEKMASLGLLVAGVAHEINTPVGVGITGVSHILFETEQLEKKYALEKMSQKDFERYLDQIKELSEVVTINLDKTANIIKNFKEIAIDKTSEEKKLFNVKESIEEILLSIDMILKQKEVKIQVICDDNLEVFSSRELFSQVLINLLKNSIYHGFEKEGSIFIETKIEKEIFYLTYKDNGKGIDKENIEKVFTPFFTTNRKDGGAGLGLSIIYNIVTVSLNGTVSCTSEKGEGVLIELSFPLLKA